jgi:serine/threonine protein phosphatase PrpC
METQSDPKIEFEEDNSKPKNEKLIKDYSKEFDQSNKTLTEYERKEKQHRNSTKIHPEEKIITKLLHGVGTNEEITYAIPHSENSNSIEKYHIGKTYSVTNTSNKSFIEFSYNEEQNATSKDTMEDKGKSIENYNENENNSLFILFDGHNGDQVSKYCQNHFDIILRKNLSNKSLSTKRAITKTFQELDNELKEKGFVHVGSTGTCLYLTEENGKKIIYCGNIGDTRCTLYGKRVERLTVDHRVDDIREKDRIINAGGFIMNGRVNGQLMLTRVFGDFEFKTFGVKCDPSVVRKVFDDKIENQFILLASDGIWDMFEEKDIKDIIEDLMEKNKDNKEKCITKIICDYLIEESLKAGGWDNISIFTIKMT